MLTLTATLREYAMYLGKGTPQSTLLTVAAGAKATEATSPDSVEGSTVCLPQSQQEGLLVTDLEYAGVETGKVCIADFVLDLNNRFTSYLSPVGESLQLGFFVRAPRFTITNGNASAALLISIHSLSLTYYDYTQLLRSLAYQMAPPFAKVEEPEV